MTVHKHDPEIRKINKEFRDKGGFRRTEVERAITKASNIRQITGETGDYRALLESLLSEIVNSSL